MLINIFRNCTISSSSLMVGFCHLTDSHHYHHGQKPTRVGICHGGNMLGNRNNISIMIMMMMMMMVTQHIPTMTDSHHGGFLSVMIMVGICQVTNSHHKWWWRNLFGTIPTKMLITTWSYIYTYYQPPAFHASQTLSEKCQKSARPLKLLYSLNTGHHHHHARAE